MSRRLPKVLLLALTLLVLTLAAQQMTGLSAKSAAVLLAAGVLAQGFASYEKPARDFAEPRRRLLGGTLSWLMRAVIGSAALGLMMAGAFWVISRV